MGATFRAKSLLQPESFLFSDSFFRRDGWYRSSCEEVCDDLLKLCGRLWIPRQIGS